MPQLFRPSANLWMPGLLWGLLAAVSVYAGVSYGLFESGWQTGAARAREQPIAFSHAHHVDEDGIDCRYCHTSVEDSAFAGFPSSETCMHCHAVLFADSPMLAPVRASFATGEALRWVRVHDLPDFVYFDHSVHIHKGVGCETCHGRVDRMATIRQTAPLTMKWCVDCHRDPGPYLRPLDQIFTMGWTPTGDPRTLVRALHVHPRLSCSGCHR
jgi:hypothetical protein